MNPSLSVVLPVCNAQATLVRQVDELLDILPELTDQFEVLIVDDGSSDHTEEISYDLARQYPQLRVVRNKHPHGAQAALDTALDQTSGDVVFVQDSETPVCSTDLHRLWDIRDNRVVRTHTESAARRQSSLVDRLVTILRRQIEQERAESPLSESGGVRMLRRDQEGRKAKPEPRWLGRTRETTAS